MENCSRRIKWYESKRRNLNILQIYKKGLEFSFVSGEYEQCHEFLFCKDFLQTIIFSNIRNKPINIFNFMYNPERNPRIHTDELRILFRSNNDANFDQNLKNSILFINEMEGMLGMRKSESRRCENGCWMVRGSKRWLKAPPMISLFVLLVRVGMTHKPENSFQKTVNDMISEKIKPYQNKDSTLLRDSFLGMDKIIKMGDGKIFYKKMEKNYPNLTADCIHNDTGILSYTNEIRKKIAGSSVVVPRWHLF